MRKEFSLIILISFRADRQRRRLKTVNDNEYDGGSRQSVPGARVRTSESAAQGHGDGSSDPRTRELPDSRREVAESCAGRQG
jgi:hypothetical protein